MPIVSSVLSEEGEQRDGRHWVNEVHTDHLGQTHVASWLAEPNDNASQIMADRVPSIEATLKTHEIETNVATILVLGSLTDTSLDHSTVNENFAVLREAYKTALEVEAVMAGDFLSSQSDAVLRNVFAMTQPQVNNLRTNKLTPAANTAASIRASSGA